MSRVAAELRKKKTLAKEAEEVDQYNGEDELLTLMNGIIGSDKITSITGHSDMTKVEHLSIVIDTNVQSIFNLCELLPNLKHLVLDNSIISSVRDLGIGLRHITSLSLSFCGLNDLDGIGVLTGLQEICLSDNFITDVAPLAMHENLQTLNVTGNKLTDISMGDALSSCPKLKSLFLSRNPIARAPNYRIIMSSLISSLEMLDGTPVDHQSSRSRVTNGMILEAAGAMREMEEDLEDEARLEGDILERATLDEFESGNKKDAVGASRFTNPSLTSSPFKPSRNVTEQRNNSNINHNSMDTGSDLTHGSSVVLAGNMTAGMRKRRNKIAEDAAGGRDSSDLTLLDGDDFESALDVLDSAMGTGTGGRGYNPANDFPFSPVSKSPRGGNNNSGGQYVFTQFMKEGDITSAVVAQNSTNGIKQRMHSTSKHTDPNSSFLEVEIDGDEEEDFQQGRYAPFSANSSPRPESMRSSRVSDSPSAARKSRMESEDLARASRSDLNGRPKTAAKPGSAGSDRGTEPRQLNGSRPQSAMSTTSSNGSFSARNTSTSLLNSSFSVPFKVNHGEFSRPSSVGSTMSSRRPSRGNSFSDFDPEDIAESTLVAKGIAGSPAAGYAPSFNKLPAVKAAGTSTSIVHYDIVKRHHSSSDSGRSTPKGGEGSSSGISGGEVTSSSRAETAEDEDSSSDTENISVTHAARRRLMAASASTTNTSTTRARNQVLQQLFTTTSDKSGAGSRPGSGSSTPTREKKTVAAQKPAIQEATLKRPPVKPSATTISSKAGISLGFNLAGSLAAIDRWVSDMNSEEEEQDGDSDEEEGNHAQAVTPMTGRDRDHGEITISSPTKGLTSSASNNGLLAGGAKDSRILSRDTIINMCWQGNSRSTSRRSAAQSDSDEEEDNGRASNTPSKSNRSAPNGVPKLLDITATSHTSKRSETERSSVQIANSSSNNATTSRIKTAAVPGFASPTASSSSSSAQPSRPRVSAPVAETAAVATPSKRRKDVTVDHTTLLDTSPPRFTSSSSSTSNASTAQPGGGVYLSDAEIVELLKKPPKATAVLRTKGSFQDYFRGISGVRMKALLSEAYSEVEDAADREIKVNKRMDLLKEVVV